jgi:3'(2'), 5'-bisphosphate nucleotidase
MSSLSAETQSLLQEVRLLAERAGAAALQFYGVANSVSLKSDSSPLTDADRASHELLVASLPLLTPGVPVVSEESHDPAQEVAQAPSAFWLVDPLDGTKEFLKGTGEFTVNIALVEHGRPRLGVVYAPVLRRTFFADSAGGAFCQDDKQAPYSIRTRRPDWERLRVVASKDHAGLAVQAMLRLLKNPELRSMGSSLKFCLVAEGEADIYLRDVPTMEWDTAAAQCVVEAAGGLVMTLDGQPLRYGKPGLKNPSLITVGEPAMDWKPLIQA